MSGVVLSDGSFRVLGFSYRTYKTYMTYTDQWPLVINNPISSSVATFGSTSPAICPS